MTGMGGVLRTLALLGLAAAVIVGGRFLWNRRPWRPAVVVNGRILSVGELDLRARALLDDARRSGNRLVAPGRKDVDRQGSAAGGSPCTRLCGVAGGRKGVARADRRAPQGPDRPDI